MSLVVGPVRTASPLAQAALSGYSDGPMRRLARRFGAAYALAEVLIDRFAVEARSETFVRRHLRLADDDHPVGGQLMGSDPLQFQAAARRLVEAGFDVIDVNFGCPSKSAVGGCRGGYHLAQPTNALEIVARVRETVPPHVPVTVKMRRGIDGSDESREKCLEILDGVFRLGAAAVTLHGRTVEQGYVGASRWAFVKEAKAAYPDRTILGSGDLFTATDCVRMLAETGVDGVSVARGAIGNPWIFANAAALLRGEPHPAPPRLPAQREVLTEHLRLAREVHGDDDPTPRLRKHLVKYARLHPRHADVRNAFGRVNRVADIEAVLARWYADDAEGVWGDEWVGVVSQRPPSDGPVAAAATDFGVGDPGSASRA
ncbi:MAG: tRNA-dihydrouridine synthase [Planctomycetota bacterium]